MWWRSAMIAAVVGLGLVSTARAEVTVYCPGAMTEALDDVAAAAARAGLAVKVVGGHSPAQARQIVAGAPADIYIAADPQWMEFLQAKAMVAPGVVANLAATRLVLIAPAGSALGYGAKPGESLAAALGDGRLAIGDPDMVPAGRFARAALEWLGAWSALAGRLAMLPHVGAVVAMVERGEVPAGIGFASDVAGNPRIRVVTEFPAEAAPPVVFPIAIVSGHDRPEIAAVLDFIRGERGRAVLRAHGFLDPTP